MTLINSEFSNREYLGSYKQCIDREKYINN